QPFALQGSRLMKFTPSFLALLENFRQVFTAPAFRLFVLLLTGWALSCRHRFITECLFTAGQVSIGHWSRFHRFWSSPRKMSAGLRVTRTVHTRPGTGSPRSSAAAHDCKTLRCTRTHSLAPHPESGSPHRGSAPSSATRKNFPSARCPSNWLGGSCYR